ALARIFLGPSLGSQLDVFRNEPQLLLALLRGLGDRIHLVGSDLRSDRADRIQGMQHRQVTLRTRTPGASRGPVWPPIALQVRQHGDPVPRREFGAFATLAGRAARIVDPQQLVKLRDGLPGAEAAQARAGRWALGHERRSSRMGEVDAERQRWRGLATDRE